LTSLLSINPKGETFSKKEVKGEAYLDKKGPYSLKDPREEKMSG
jgi:hypothetical protein